MNDESNNFDPGSCLARCADGDQSAWNEMVDQYAGLVQSIARSLGVPEEQRDDVVQIVFAILFRRLDSIQDPESLPKWLMVTTRRECWRQMRARRRQTDLEAAIRVEPVAPAGDDSSDAIESEEDRSLVRAGLAMIGDRCRQLLMALFGDGGGSVSYEIISERLGIPVGSIGPTRARCLKRLMERVEGLRQA